MYYLALRPQTVVSVVFTGKLPETLPTWFAPKNLVLYANPKEAVANSASNKVNEIFLLELSCLAKASVSKAADAGAGSPGAPEIDEQFALDEIDTKTISRILVNSTSATKLLQRLLNTDSPFRIDEAPEHFKCFIPSVIPAASRSTAVSSLMSYPALKPGFTVRQGDLLGSRAQTLINTVNCVGVMGKGVALLFKNAYPEMFLDYKARCDRKELRLGKPYLYRVNAKRWIINFPTKGHWRNNSALKDIETGLRYLAENATAWGISSLAIPSLGCGNGNLSWGEVYPLITHYLRPLGIAIEVYEPFDASKAARLLPAKRPRTSLFDTKATVLSEDVHAPDGCSTAVIPSRK